MDNRPTDQLLKLHAVWKTTQDSKQISKKKGPQSFRWYVMTHERVVYQELLLNPSVLNSLPKPIQRDWRGDRRLTIGPKVLQKYGAAILRAYLAESEKGTFQGTFEDFVNRVILKECETKEDLKVFLQKFFPENFSP